MSDSDAESESYAERARRARSDELRSTLRLCEERLRRLKKPADAWRFFQQVVWNGTPRPGMLKDLGALRKALGKEWDTIERPRPPRDTPGTDAFSQAVRDVAATEGISLFEAWSVVTVRQPRLYAQYQRELRRTFGNVRHREPYRHAEVAALMAAALERLDDPVAMFAAGLALGEYHQYDHQHHFVQRSRQELLKRIGEQARDRAAAGGRSKRGKVLPHTELIRRALCFDPEQNDRGEDWFANAPVHRTPAEMVDLFADADVVRDLIEHQPRVALSGAWFDEDAKALAFEYSDRPNRKVKVASLPSTIARLLKSYQMLTIC